MATLSRIDRNQTPGTQSAGSPEGAVADGKMAAVIEITLFGTPAQIAADYATLAGTTVTSSSGAIKWRKR